MSHDGLESRGSVLPETHFEAVSEVRALIHVIITNITEPLTCDQIHDVCTHLAPTPKLSQLPKPAVVHLYVSGELVRVLQGLVGALSSGPHGVGRVAEDHHAPLSKPVGGEVRSRPEGAKWERCYSGIQVGRIDRRGGCDMKIELNVLWGNWG